MQQVRTQGLAMRAAFMLKLRSAIRMRKRHANVPAWRVAAAKRLDQLLALPMLVITIVFLVVLVLPMVDHHLSPATRSILAIIDIGIWAAFLAEYLARLFVAPNRLTFVRRNIFDLLLVVIPLLRPLRALLDSDSSNIAALTCHGGDSGECHPIPRYDAKRHETTDSASQVRPKIIVCRPPHGPRPVAVRCGARRPCG
jgi:Ion transport protein